MPTSTLVMRKSWHVCAGDFDEELPYKDSIRLSEILTSLKVINYQISLNKK